MNIIYINPIRIIHYMIVSYVVMNISTNRINAIGMSNYHVSEMDVPFDYVRKIIYKNLLFTRII